MRSLIVVSIAMGCGPVVSGETDGATDSDGDTSGSTTVSTFPTSNPTEPVTTASTSPTSDATEAVTSVTPDTSSDVTTSATGTSSGSSEDSSSSSGSGSSSTTGSMGCNALDITFVVDDSANQLSQQATLISAFPTLVDALTSDLAEVTDVHIGVVTTDAYAYNDGGCTEIGALVTVTGGVGSSNDQCGPYAAGDDFMTYDDDLATEFACAAAVGTSGNPYEMPMAAMLAAVDGTHAGAGGCNEGFIREDAIGVVVVLTDEWDGPDDPEGDGSPGTPDDWFSDLIATKNDDETRFVVGLLVNEPVACEPADIYYDTTHIIDFGELFTHRVIAGQCEADYTPFMSDLADEIVAACAAA